MSSSSDPRALVVTWASGGNLPSLLAAGQLLSARGFSVRVLTSQATRTAASERGLPTLAYWRAPEPRSLQSNSGMFEAQGTRAGGAILKHAHATSLAETLQPAR